MREYLTEEFGLDAARLTATDLLYLVEGPRSGGEPAETDPSDERYHVHGGNDQVPHACSPSACRTDALHLDAPLEALWRRGDGSYGLRLGGIRGDVAADQVVLAAPFTTLREVDLGRAGLSALKRRCIEELGMGTNAKVLMQFRHRPAHFHRWNGDETTDRPSWTPGTPR